MQLLLDIKTVSVLIRENATDIINLTIVGPSPFPEMAKEAVRIVDYYPTFKIEVRKGYAEEWLAKVNIREYQIINSVTGEIKWITRPPKISKERRGFSACPRS